MIEASASLRYKLALSKNGMCDEPRSRMTVAEKLELLTAHSAASNQLHAVQDEWVESLVGWSAPVAVSGNICVFTRSCNGATCAHEADAPADAHLDLLVVRVPAPLRRIEGAQWILWLPESVSELCIDAAQDLLVYALRDGTLCVRTLSTGVVPPLVIGHSGCFKVREGHSSLSFDVFNPCVCGDYIATGIRPYLISVWNWKTGALVTNQISDVTFSSFDFLDDYHILFADTSRDRIHVYDVRGGSELDSNAKGGHQHFQLDLPPIHRATTSRYIQIRRNALPMRVQDQAQHELHGGDGSGGGVLISLPPFHADPRARLVVLRIVTSPVDFGEEQFELHVPAQALLKHFATKSSDAAATPPLPWSAWRADTAATPVRSLPYLPQARMITYGMRVVSHPPDWDEGFLYIDSYPPRRTSAVKVGSGDGAGTRQSIPLPDKSPAKAHFLSSLCEDGLLCYQLDPSLTRILHASWFSI
ncbi:hypothetical protein EI94DRAFT_1723958 [Lactarius quietus]|nr:hypothetical protein EI94DRAFT_1723958 [Lactarius quietus]